MKMAVYVFSPYSMGNNHLIIKNIPLKPFFLRKDLKSARNIALLVNSLIFIHACILCCYIRSF